MKDNSAFRNAWLPIEHGNIRDNRRSDRLHAHRKEAEQIWPTVQLELQCRPSAPWLGVP
jgi:hypothetical protein